MLDYRRATSLICQTTLRSVLGESDLLSTNGEAHWIRGAYMINKQVQFELRHIFQERLLRTGPENRWLNRLQFDVHYRF